jgi:hypothetical protein
MGQHGQSHRGLIEGSTSSGPFAGFISEGLWDSWSPRFLVPNPVRRRSSRWVYGEPGSQGLVSGTGRPVPYSR